MTAFIVRNPRQGVELSAPGTVGIPHTPRPDLYPSTIRDAVNFIVCGAVVAAVAVVGVLCLFNGGAA